MLLKPLTLSPEPPSMILSMINILNYPFMKNKPLQTLICKQPPFEKSNISTWWRRASMKIHSTWLCTMWIPTSKGKQFKLLFKLLTSSNVRVVLLQVNALAIHVHLECLDNIVHTITTWCTEKWTQKLRWSSVWERIRSCILFWTLKTKWT